MSQSTIAVLCSGGLDSAVLVAEAGRDHTSVVPIYIRSGLIWESVELSYLRRFLSVLSAVPSVSELVVFDIPVADIYTSHWSLSGANVPAADTSDEAVYLPGRNLLLLSKALLWCHLHGTPALAVGILAGNPFPDATPSFFQAMADVVNRAVDGHVRIEAPFAGLSKVDVIRRGRGLPLQHTFSCLAPVQGRHCGRCNKCAERKRAFASARIIDPTEYDQVH
jgi:7-cyano-7-deazaguanine synthase